MSTIRATYVQHGSSSVPNITLNASGQVIVASGIVSSGTFAAPSGSAAAPGIYFNGDSNTGLYSPAADTIAFTEGGVEALRIDSSGRVGIGVTDPGSYFSDARNLVVGNTAGDAGVSIVSNSSNKGTIAFADGTTGDQAYRGYIQYSHNGDALAFATSGTEAFRVDSSRRLLVGTSSARSNFFNGSVSALHQVEGANNTDQRMSAQIYGSADAASSVYIFAKHRSNSIGGNTVVVNGDELGQISFQGSDGTQFVAGAQISAFVDGTPGADDLPSRLVFSTTADGASSPTERMRITSNGNISIGGEASPTYKLDIRVPNNTQTSGSLVINNANGIGSIYMYNVSGTGVNTSNAAIWVEKNTLTNRSINAGGTINASGADYAEYMVKAGDFDIAKGAVCGITSNGLLTPNYADAVSFVVKSTNPSYVGGDTWGSEDAVGPKPDTEDVDALAQWEAVLEAARQKVDRIAFAGQVPVNVMGATPGQYIVPVEVADGGIEGIAKNETDLTLAEYMRAVGKVIAIEDDGRARIIVKVA